ncbi:fibronectin type III domain-containing protein [Cohnella cellulosilytica]|uniref:Fibronectin type-III domain-containing protein n=1 Tax=Cohnella cellulosilytica TaxID=986710 RepID=A0ABW2FE90_9BACL
MKKVSVLISGILAMVLMYPLFLFPQTASADNISAVIDFDTEQESTYERGFRGLNNPLQKGAISFLDDDFIEALKDANTGWSRYGSGTVVGDYNWKLGEPDDEYIAQYRLSSHMYEFVDYRRYVIAKGKEHFKDFYESARLTGTKIIVTVNTFTETPKAVGDLAKYVKDNHIDVEYWQLGNEPYFLNYIGDAGVRPKFYNGANDYLNKAKAFNDEIKQNLPDAKTLIYYAPNPEHATNATIKNYPAPFWDGISFHQYRGNGSTVAEAVVNTNQALAEWEDRIAEYERQSWNGVPMVIPEYGVSTGGMLEGTLYHGIFIAESVLQATKYSNIKFMGGFRAYGGLVTPGNPRFDEAEDAFQDGQSVDTTGWDFDSYSLAPALALKIIDHAINNGNSLWATTVTGGATVNTATGTLPALYAQAYKGDNGINYVTIVNKSDQAHDVAVQEDGNPVTASLTKTYVTSTDPGALNTDSARNTVSIQVSSTSNPVTVPPYSVMRVEWDAERAPEVLPTRLTHAQVTDSGEVTLKWWPLEGVSTYRILYGTSPGTYTDSIVVNNASEYAIAGLANGSTYYFAVYPETSSSVLSNEMSADLTAPAAPVIVKAYPKRNGEIGVEWKTVPKATGYKVKVGTAPGVYTSWIDVGNVAGHKLTGLTNGTTHYVAVSAYNGIGESGNSDELSAIPRSNLPYAPNNLRFQKVDSNSVKLTWDPSYVEVMYDGFEDGSMTDTVKNNVNDLDTVWSVENGTFSIEDHPTRANAKVLQSGASGEHLAVSGNSGWVNYDIEAKFESTDWNQFGGVVARYDSVTDSYYRLIASAYDCSGNYSSTDKYIKLQKVINGNPTGSDLICEPTSHSKMKLRLQVSGSKLSAFLDNVIVGEATDNALSQGQYGVISKNQTTLFDRVAVYKTNTPQGTYHVYRSTVPYPGPGTLVATVNSAPYYEYTDTGLTPGTQYYYRVYAENDQGMSNDYSNIVPVKL